MRVGVYKALGTICTVCNSNTVHINLTDDNPTHHMCESDKSLSDERHIQGAMRTPQCYTSVCQL